MIIGGGVTIGTVCLSPCSSGAGKKMQKPSIATGNSLVKRIECLLSPLLKELNVFPAPPEHGERQYR